jgi:hypothetical protein
MGHADPPAGYAPHRFSNRGLGIPARTYDRCIWHLQRLLISLMYIVELLRSQADRILLDVRTGCPIRTTVQDFAIGIYHFVAVFYRLGQSLLLEIALRGGLLRITGARNGGRRRGTRLGSAAGNH